MKINDDAAVMEHLFRNNVMRAYPQTLSSFCQWCADIREVVKGDAPDARALMCPTCDRGDA